MAFLSSDVISSWGEHWAQEDFYKKASASPRLLTVRLGWLQGLIPLQDGLSGHSDCDKFACSCSETEIATSLLLLHPEKWVVTCLISHSSLKFELQGQKPRPRALFFFPPQCDKNFGRT